jgi:thioesterase domain-containing protein
MNGKDVVFLGLLDTMPPGPQRQAIPLERVKIHMINLQRRNFVETLQYFRHSILRFVARIRNKTRTNAIKIKRYAQEGLTEDRRMLIIGTYKPEPFQGTVTLFSCTERPWYIRWDPMEPWRKYLIGQLNIVPIPGDHMSALQHPHVAVLAEKIKALLPQRGND